jgi:DNA-directed RNA polymerase subunit RPC12/RpoP
MPKVEVDFSCRKCKNTYPATITFSGKAEDLDLADNQSRCPYCGAWNCADPKAVRAAAKETGRG